MARDSHRWQPRCRPPDDLVAPVPVDPGGRVGPTPAEARGPHWRRTTPGLFVPSWVRDDVPEQRILEQAARLPVADSGVTAWAACRMHGAAFFDGLSHGGRARMPVPLALGAKAQLRPWPGSRLLRARLTWEEVQVVAGVSCTVPRRALFDAMRTASTLDEAVVAMDMMAAAEIVSITQMREYAGTHPAWTGVPQVRKALDLADEASRSPAETRMRLIWVRDAQLPPPLVNQPIWTRHGQLLGIADLLDPLSGTVGEFDGADHREAARHTRDVAREQAMREVGLEYFTVTGNDLSHPHRVVARMHGARARAQWLADDVREWTTVPPPGWRTAPSLDERLGSRAEAAVLRGETDTWSATA
jgi:hypothetical protein